MIRTILLGLFGIIAGRLAFVFLDEILGLERAARSAARGVA